MTDNFEDFEHEHEHVEGDVHEPQGQVPTGFRANLKGAWRSQPLFKLFVLMVVVGAVVAVGVSFFSGSASKSAVGLMKPPDLHEAPGGKSSPYLKEQTEMANKQRTDEAIQNGGSALPTPIGPGSDNSDFNAAAAKEDPLNELRAEVDSMNKQLQETKQAQAVPQQAPAQQEQFDDSLAQAMQKQMGQLLDSWAPKGTRQVTVTDTAAGSAGAPGALQSGGVGAPDATGGTSAAAAAIANPVYKTIVSAGTVSYAQLLTEANSDVPGPILAQIVSGPLKGARAVGEFKVANGYSDYLTLTFRVANLKGVDYQIHALALDPDTTLGGMATEVDQRYLIRLVLPAAAGFLQGFGSALGQGSSTITANGTTTIIQQSGRSFQEGEYNGLSNAANTAAQFFQNQANQTKPLVRVAAGTPMGLFFVETVTDSPLQTGQNQTGGVPNNGFYNNPYGFNNGMQNNGLGYGNGYGAAGYGNAYGNGYNPYATSGYGAVGASGYPAIYPNPVTAAPLNSSVNVLGTGGYPASNVYYTH